MLPGTPVQMIEDRALEFYEAEPEWGGVKVQPGSTVYTVFSTRYVDGVPFILLRETLRSEKDVKFPYPQAWFRPVGVVVAVIMPVTEHLDTPRAYELSKHYK